MSDTAQLNHQWAAQILHSLAVGGVRHAIIAPGARSTALVAAAESNPRICTQVVTDERVAAFVALGIGQSTRQPAALITTSGSAIAHAHPAVIEASAAGHPLIIISADRPPELHEVGANQATEQLDLFRVHAGPTVALPAPEWVGLSAVAGRIARAVARGRTGPVHINCPFRKPLIGDDSTAAPHRTTVEWPSGRTFSEGALTVWRTGLSATRRGVLVVGSLPNSESRIAVQTLADHLCWPVLADVCSGVEGLPHAELWLEHHGDLIAPDTVLHVGGRLVSAPIERWVARAKPARCWVLDPKQAPYDPVHAVTDRFRVNFTEAFTACPRVEPHPQLHEIGTTAQALAVQIADVLDDLGACTGPGAARAIWQASSAPLIMGNSTPVRDFEAYRPAAVRIAHASRGVSGIDGTCSTALGWTLGRAEPVVVALGDQALLHDLGALLVLSEIGADVTIVVINNDGGGIFERLAVAAHPALMSRYFVAPHGRDFASISAAFGLPYVCCDQAQALRTALSEPALGPRVIEVRTDRARDTELRARLAQLNSENEERP